MKIIVAQLNALRYIITKMKNETNKEGGMKAKTRVTWNKGFDQFHGFYNGIVVVTGRTRESCRASLQAFVESKATN